jgi:hypothetical protein
MKISSLRHEIKMASRAAMLAAASALQLSACAAPVREAPFSARPDTVEAGELAGPFDGQVVDAATGKPISGALVFASWGLEVGRGLSAPAGAVSVTASTDSDGRYTIARLNQWPGRRTRVERFTLIVYRAGYIAYRSDRRFEDLGERHDFAQRGNRVRLDRFPSGTSHVRHVRFIGGGAPVRSALGGEVIQASLELAAGPAGEAPVSTGVLLDATGLLSEDELRAVTGYAGPFAVERLGDLPQSSSYDSKHFRATDKPESFDAAIRVWKLSGAQAAEARYQALAAEVPSAEVRDEVGDRSLRGHDGKIIAAATLDRAGGLVVELTCGVDLCRDEAQTVGLLRRVLARAQRGPTEAAEPKSAGEPTRQEATPKQAEPPKEEPPPEDKPFQLRPPEMRR